MYKRSYSRVVETVLMMPASLVSSWAALLVIHGMTSVCSFQCPELSPCECRIEEDGRRILDCDNTGISEIPDLQGIPQQTVGLITLRNNSIRNISADTFDGLDVAELDLSYNILTNIASNAFQHVKESISKLVMDGVGISFKNKLAFLENMTSLVELSLNDNVGFPIHLPNGFFKNMNLNSLRTLSLKRCQMLILGELAFVGLDNLEELDISHNDLSSIPSALLHLRSLKTLIISHNKELTYIHHLAFEKMSQLTELHMGHSNIEYIEDNAFDGLENSLEVLDMNHCSLSFGHFSVLQTLKHLRKLDLSYNRISHIRNESFGDLEAIEDLDIGGNPIIFTATMFRGLENKLKILRIQSMNRSTLPLESLSLLNSLEILDASKNKFSSIYDGFFSGVSASTIWMTDMKIKTVEAAAFNDLQPPISLNLDNNAIRDLSFVVKVKACSLDTLSLKGNPLTCDCVISIITKSNMVKHLSGTCANKGYTGKSITTVGVALQADRDCQIESEDIYTCGACVTFPRGTIYLVIALFIKIFVIPELL
ncbi:hypothetical protein ScPMuIL_018519 [Solemya velum]